MLVNRTVFKMYVKDGCPFCDKAKDIILNELKCSLHSIDVSKDSNLRELIIEDTGQKTVPVIFLGDEFIGGCDDLTKLSESSSFRLKVIHEEVLILRDEVSKLRRSL
jgi:glutaredoxin 3